MKAVIIAGGFGTRLRPLTHNTPKPIVPFLNRPFVVHQIELLAQHGVDEIILNLHYLSNEIKKALGDGKKWGVKIYYSIEESPLGTAGAVKNAEQYFGDEPMLVFNGDVLCGFNLSQIVNYHYEKKATVTLTLTEVPDPTSFGLIMCDSDGRVKKFVEKPRLDMISSGTINAGVYVIDPKIFNNVPKGKPYSFERQLYPDLLEAGVPIYGYIAEEYWIDVGNPHKYKEAHQAVLHGEVEIALPGVKGGGRFWIGQGSQIDKSVSFLGPALVGEKVKIGSETELHDSVVLGDRVIVGQNSRLDRVIVWENSKIGSRVKLADSVIGKNCEIEDDVVIEGGIVLADGSTIRKGTRLID